MFKTGIVTGFGAVSATDSLSWEEPKTNRRTESVVIQCLFPRKEYIGASWEICASKGDKVKTFVKLSISNADTTSR